MAWIQGCVATFQGARLLSESLLYRLMVYDCRLDQSAHSTTVGINQIDYGLFVVA